MSALAAAVSPLACAARTRSYRRSAWMRVTSDVGRVVAGGSLAAPSLSRRGATMKTKTRTRTATATAAPIAYFVVPPFREGRLGAPIRSPHVGQNAALVWVPHFGHFIVIILPGFEATSQPVVDMSRRESRSSLPGYHPWQASTKLETERQLPSY